MATLLGSTAHSASHAYWFGSGNENQHAARLTLPAGGPWIVSKVGVWAAGKDASPSARLVLWANGGAVLGQSGSFTLANGGGIALGASDKYEKDLQTPVEVNGGTTVMVGIAWNDTGAGQFDTGDSGNTYSRQRDSWPGSMSGFSTISGDEINAWLYYDPATPQIYVRRSGVWVRADDVLVRRSGAWDSVGAEAYARRSGSWSKVD